MPDKELRLLINDTIKFVSEDVDDYEANQQTTCVKHLFRGSSVKAWKGAQDDKKKCTNLSRIINQHYVACFYKCWKDRNENLHDEATKRKRVIECKQKEHRKSMNG